VNRFLFRFLEKDGLYVPAIVTNKHVIQEMSKGTFLFTSTNDDGTPNNLLHIPVNIDEFEKAWIISPRFKSRFSDYAIATNT